jgi:hypothetical protein
MVEQDLHHIQVILLKWKREREAISRDINR